MIYKVYYQENILEVPVRENTKSLYIEADEVREVREKLQGRGYKIEYIQSLEGNYLEYEKASEDFKLENI